MGPGGQSLGPVSLSFSKVEAVGRLDNNFLFRIL